MKERLADGGGIGCWVDDDPVFKMADGGDKMGGLCVGDEELGWGLPGDVFRLLLLVVELAWPNLGLMSGGDMVPPELGNLAEALVFKGAPLNLGEGEVLYLGEALADLDWPLPAASLVAAVAEVVLLVPVEDSGLVRLGI